MAIQLPSQNALFLHVPKCAGFWVEEALLRTGVALQLLPHPNDPLRADRHATLKDLGLKPDLTCAFIRHPIKWYESWWQYTAGRPHNWDQWRWHPTYLLQKCRSIDFNTFIDKMLANERGFLTRLYRNYLGDFDDPTVQMIGRVENMVEDFTAMLHIMNVSFFPNAIEKIPPQNVGYSLVGRPIWRDDQKELVVEAEQPIISKWYDNESISAR